MKWSLTWADKTWTEDDLRVAHLVLITEGLGEDTWDFTPTGGPRKLLAVLGAFIAVESGLQLVEVMVALSQVPASDLLAGLQVVEE